MFVDHVLAREIGLPPMPEGLLYQYVIAANGVFVRSWRPGLAAMIPVNVPEQRIRGLVDVRPYVHLEMGVPLRITARMFELAYRAGKREILFYLSGGSREQGKPWTLRVPEQEQASYSVHPVDEFAGGADTVIEVHSHHHMSAFFSRVDDIEERAGFRLYGVIGELGRERPQMRVRVGIYGHFYEIPASSVFYNLQGLIEPCEVDDGA